MQLRCLMALPVLATALTFDCTHTRVSGQSYDFSALGGPKTVHWQRWQPPSTFNFTFTLDLCQALPKKDSSKDNCSTGTRVCGIERVYHSSDPNGEGEVSRVIDIAGDYYASHGRALDAEVKQREKDTGIDVTFHGGKYPDTRQGRLQQAVVQFDCDRDWSGAEGFDAEGVSVLDDKEPDSPELPDLDKGRALQFVSYGADGDIDTLRVRWKTKYACEGVANEPDKLRDDARKSHLGFFAWMLIIIFLLAAAYIIFGSWLNYNRYGARGWDLIPHGDTIRDIPYNIREVSKKLFTNDRGGYSAV
ncbi:hypothetical protein K470DRAFT_217551 [Piedraia hortae CBS 480.64]|uniref:Autophagy-related protein 27 n=1 Tax=Piedraia hortae CBS 480.64 TaxID=1314780 RepID=A0A6A7BYB3_9PEZI|nr:hypothetical protein K470DRAFT_217551 [Piedraia hortae CBS 480.64]